MSAACELIDVDDDIRVGRTKNEVFMFINVILSDLYIERLRDIGKQPKRNELDKGKKNHDCNAFWLDVSSEMAAALGPDVSSEFTELTKDPKGHLEKADIDILSSNVKFTEPVKDLQKMYLKLRTDWTNANTKFHLSGTHDSDFWNFCGGNLHLYYFNLMLSRKGSDVINSVSTDLPSGALLASTESNSCERKTTTTNRSPNRRDEIASQFAIHSQNVMTIGSERNDIMRAIVSGDKRRKLLHMVTTVNKDTVATGNLIDSVRKDLVPLVKKKDNETLEERMNRESVERKHNMLNQLMKTMDRLSSSFDKANTALEELDAAENEGDDDDIGMNVFG